MSALFIKYGDWIRWAALMVLIPALNAVYTANFVTRTEFRQEMQGNNAAHIAIQTSIGAMEKTLAVIAENKAVLNDQEARLRVVEARQTDVLARLAAEERETVDIRRRLVRLEDLLGGK